MSRVGLIVAASAAVMSFALGGCSGSMPSMPDWMTPSMPDWLSSKPSAPELQSLRVESEPPGADVRTAQGQGCITPCAVAVPSAPQAVTISRIGYVPQTVQVTVGDPPEHSFWESPPPMLIPNPVRVILQPLPPPPKPMRRVKPRPRPAAARTQTAAKTTPATSAPTGFPAPAAQQPASPFPPPQ